MNSLQAEVARRRTFAIISHPDAGKTTLTEKLLLYGGAIQLAGSVRGAQEPARTPPPTGWRWSSSAASRSPRPCCSSTYRGTGINLLDTPGHQDFSEDTYRTLTAADSAVMVHRRAPRASSRRRASCSRSAGSAASRSSPSSTRWTGPAASRWSCSTRSRRCSASAPCPINWPIGDGPDFRGVYDRRDAQVHLLRAHASAARVARAGRRRRPRRPALERSLLARGDWRALREEIELLDGARARRSTAEQFLRGEMTPVFFGSAADELRRRAVPRRASSSSRPPPRPARRRRRRPSAGRRRSSPASSSRSRRTWTRSTATASRSCASAPAASSATCRCPTRVWARRSASPAPHKLFAQDRETIDEAFPGDIIGLTNPGSSPSATRSACGAAVRFEDIPRFAPEYFASLREPAHRTSTSSSRRAWTSSARRARSRSSTPHGSARREPILAAVGQLQFEVVQFRLQSEYGVDTGLMRLPFEMARWLTGPAEDLRRATWLPAPARWRTGESAWWASSTVSGRWRACRRRTPPSSSTNTAPIGEALAVKN